MHLTFRPLEEDDYFTLVKWWKSWGWDVVPSRELLPDSGTSGVMVMCDDTPVCAGFIYGTNSRMAWISWVVSDPEYRKKPNRKSAIEFLVNTLKDIVRSMGYIACYMNSNSKNLNEISEKCGFKKGSLTQEMIMTWA
jgi:hypothetical protein